MTATYTAKWDRKATIRPDYLEQLRNRGHWRSWYLVNEGYSLSLLSSALAAINFGQQLQTKPEVFLDAGCGYSPDALLAVQRLGFKRAYKLDLFSIDTGNEYRYQDIKKLEGNKVKFMQHDICDLSWFDDNCVSVIGCNAMIDLLTPDERLLFYSEAFRILQPGGLLSVAYVPLAAGYGDWGDWKELKILREIGFEHANKGRFSIIIVRKPL